jgi:cation diffusion facilitator CzcD-associated flavoprotein CzcO
VIITLVVIIVFTGKRVAVGTGSSSIQSIPVIADQAAQLDVFQRTPNFSVPAGNKPLTVEDMAKIKADYADRRRLSWRSGGGSPHIPHSRNTMEYHRRSAAQRSRSVGN